jgi:hypothetical protein
MSKDITHLQKSQDALKEEHICMCRIWPIILLQQAAFIKTTRLCPLHDAHYSAYQSSDADLHMKARTTVQMAANWSQTFPTTLVLSHTRNIISPLHHSHFEKRKPTSNSLHA